jgi:hypothetical protein
MRAQVLKVITFSLLLSSAVGILAIGPASATSTWGSAQAVAGSLNTNGYATINSISCSSAGN